MSEYQNKAMELLVARFGDDEAQDMAQRRERLLEDALALYRALGGTSRHALAQVQTSFSQTPGVVPDCIGEVMSSLAGIAHLNDVDMMQAAYNILDLNWKYLDRTRQAG